MSEEFEFESGVLNAHVEDAVAQVLAFGELRAHRSHILRPTVEEHLLVHQMLLPGLADEASDQLLEVRLVIIIVHINLFIIIRLALHTLC